MSARVACIAAILSWGACRNHPEPAPAAPSPSNAILTPTQVIEAIHALRRSGRLADVENYVVPAERGYQVPVILAVDQVLSANAALHSEASARFGPALAMGLDLSEIGDSYHVFSRRLRVIREVVTGEHATVMVQEGERVPLVDVPLARLNGRWLVKPQRPEPQLPERLLVLAHTLATLREDLGPRIKTFAELDNAFRNRVLPRLLEIGSE